MSDMYAKGFWQSLRDQTKALEGPGLMGVRFSENDIIYSNRLVSTDMSVWKARRTASASEAKLDERPVRQPINQGQTIGIEFNGIQTATFGMLLHKPPTINRSQNLIDKPGLATMDQTWDRGQLSKQVAVAMGPGACAASGVSFQLCNKEGATALAMWEEDRDKQTYRKQKCDDQLPICSSCLRAGVDCDKVDVANDTVSGAYTKALENEVAALENILAEHGISRTDRDRRTEYGGFDQPAKVRHALKSPARVDPTPTAAGSVSTGAETGIHDGAGDQSDGSANISSLGQLGAPGYVSPSSGLSLAMNLGEIVQATIWRKALPESSQRDTVSREAPITQNPDRQMPFLEGQTSWGEHQHRLLMTIEELARHSVKEPPSDKLGPRLLDMYFNHLHPLYPFMNSTEVWELYRKRMELATVPAANLDTAQWFALFKLYMVYTIGATLLHLVERSIPAVGICCIPLPLAQNLDG
ncbi:hypothetical protein BJX76DRAFT_359062 [Aspergillus varians]